MIAALFVETDGCYFGIDGVDPWDVLRDARGYDGPHPVVAHPPCQRWGRMAHGGPSAPGTQTPGEDPHAGVPHEAALRVFGPGPRYEAWCCWNAIMLARDVLENSQT